MVPMKSAEGREPEVVGKEKWKDSIDSLKRCCGYELLSGSRPPANSTSLPANPRTSNSIPSAAYPTSGSSNSMQSPSHPSNSYSRPSNENQLPAGSNRGLPPRPGDWDDHQRRNSGASSKDPRKRLAEDQPEGERQGKFSGNRLTAGNGKGVGVSSAGGKAQSEKSGTPDSTSNSSRGRERVGGKESEKERLIKNAHHKCFDSLLEFPENSKALLHVSCY